jgi:hypothetical protein
VVSETSAWVLLIVAALPFLIFGVSALLFGLSLSDFPVALPGGPDAVESLTGMTWDETLRSNPAALTLLRGISRVAGMAFLGFAIFTIVVSSSAYRRGERWAWLTLWTLPAFMFGLLLHEREGGFVQMPAILLVLSLLGLLLPSRRFFQK